MDIFILLLISLFVYLIPRTDVDYLSNKSTKSLKGLLAILIIFHSPISSMIRIVLLKMGIFNIYIHIILGVVLSWYLAILLTKLFRKIKYLDIIFIPQKYIKF